MKILGAADFHGDKEAAKKLAEKAAKEDVELVILCGDIAEDDTTDNILKPFRDKKKKVLLISGNHESLATADFLATLNEAKHIHGYSVRYEDIGIFGCGAANIGIHGITEKEIFDNLKKGFDRINYLKKKIMVTHVHPEYSKMGKMTKFVPGSTGVTKAINKFKPDILLCSHVHEAEGLEEKMGKTRVINVGKEGRIINI
jgi:Icc-related predicted phosphoesterase